MVLTIVSEQLRTEARRRQQEAQKRIQEIQRQRQQQFTARAVRGRGRTGLLRLRNTLGQFQKGVTQASKEREGLSRFATGITPREFSKLQDAIIKRARNIAGKIPSDFITGDDFFSTQLRNILRNFEKERKAGASLTTLQQQQFTQQIKQQIKRELGEPKFSQSILFKQTVPNIVTQSQIDKQLNPHPFQRKILSPLFATGKVVDFGVRKIKRLF